MRRLLAVTVVATFLATVPDAAPAQTLGLRAGVSGDPTQFYGGVHVQAGPIFDHVWFRPNVEAGFGDDRTVVTLNVELVWRKPIHRQPWALLVGGGPAAVFVTRDVPGGSSTDAGAGFNVLFGFEHARGFFTEFKFGLIESPRVKVAVGYGFK